MSEVKHQSDGRRSLSLRLWHKLALGLAVLLSLFLAGAWLLFRGQLALSLQDQADRLGSALAGQAAASVTELVLANDLLSLNVVLRQLALDPAISWVAVLNVDNQVIAAAGNPPEGAASPEVYSYMAPISLQDSIAGYLQLALVPASLDQALKDSAPIFLGLWLLGLGLALLAGRVFGLHVATPLRAFSRALSERGEDGEVELPALDARRHDEVAELRAALDAFLAAAENEDATVPAFSGSDSAGARLPATLVALEVVNLNTAIELLQPATLARLLDEFQYYLEQVAERRGALLQAFNGEYALLAFTGEQGDTAATEALECAWLLARLLRQLGRRHRQAGSPALDFRLGVHTGETFLGRLGGEEAGRALLLGPVLGQTLGLSRLAAAGKVVVSEACRRQARDNPFVFAPLDDSQGEVIAGAHSLGGLRAEAEDAAADIEAALEEFLPPADTMEQR